VSKVTEKSDDDECRLVVKESKRKIRFFRSRFDLQLSISVDDFSEFSEVFEKVPNQLTQWFIKRGFRCGKLSLHCIIHPWIVSRVKEKIRRLLHPEGAFPELLAEGILVELMGTDGAPLFEGEITWVKTQQDEDSSI
jgi:hypothetical protein